MSITIDKKAVVHNSVNYYFESFTIQLSIVILSLCSCIVYITGTYGYPRLNTNTGLTFELFFFSVFLFDYIMSLIHSNVNRLRFVVSYKGITDFLSLVPILSIIPHLRVWLLYPTPWLDFLRFLRLLHICNLFNKKESKELQAFDNVLAFEVSETLLLITRLLVNITVFIFISSGFVFAISTFNKNAYRSTWVSGKKYLSWFDSCYIVITIVTTLNSDFSGIIWQARLLNLFIIIIGFSIIPVQIAMVAESLIFKQKYLGYFKKSPETEHVIVCGIVDYELLNRIITELFHPTHISPEIQQNLVLVILSPQKPSTHVSQLLRLTKLRSRLRYFIGSPKSFFDLSRVLAEQSFAIYSIGDCITTSLRFEEDSIFLNAISIQKYLQRNKVKQQTRSYNPYIRNVEIQRPVTLVKLTGPGKSRNVLKTLGINTILSNQDFKYKLLAFSSVYPGLLAVFLNLNRARSISQRKMAQLNIADQFIWQKGYYEGSRYSIQQISSRSFNAMLLSMKFGDACLSLYKSSMGKAFLVAAKVDGKVFINPNTKISECQDLFVIGTSWEDVYKFVSHRNSDHGSQTTYHPLELNLQDATENTKPSINIPKTLKRSRSSASEKKDIDKSPSMTIRKLKFSASLDTPVDKSPNIINMKGHIVLIVNSQQYLTHTEILLSLISFIRVVRKLSSDIIVVFSDRAEELIAGIKDFHSSDTPNLLTNLQWVNGQVRNEDHLRFCCIDSARCIVLIRAPIPSETNEEDDPTASLFLSADRQTIITSLNIHTILQKSAKLKETSGICDTEILPPFTIAEIVHEANINFLRNNDSLSNIDDDDPFSLNEFDWPLIASGSVLTHTLLDALMMQSVFHPDILTFWESIFNAIPRKIPCTAGLKESKLVFSPDLINLKDKEKKDDEEDADSLHASSDVETIDELNAWDEDIVNGKEIFAIDKVDVPDDFHGKPFADLFISFLQDYNCISIALYRWSISDSQLPHVVCAPSHNTILKPRDEVFILKSLDNIDI